MVLFKSRYEKELDALMTKIDMNMSNNYKDNAQADFQELMASDCMFARKFDETVDGAIIDEIGAQVCPTWNR